MGQKNNHDNWESAAEKLSRLEFSLTYTQYILLIFWKLHLRPLLYYICENLCYNFCVLLYLPANGI